MTLPAEYADLKTVSGPKMLLEALGMYGLKEAPGTPDNASLVRMIRDEAGIKGYIHDSIAWCGGIMAVWAVRAGWTVVKDPLWAQNWKIWEDPSPQASLGDVLVFVRPGGGHVGLYVGEDETAYHVLGGNSSDMVKIIRVEKSRLIAARRAHWKIAQPADVKVIHRAASGPISKNEA